MAYGSKIFGVYINEETCGAPTSDTELLLLLIEIVASKTNLAPLEQRDFDYIKGILEKRLE